jgi:ferritin-like metal-binding protein YciE
MYVSEALNARDQKLVDWLREAQAKEAYFEKSLEHHIAVTDKQAYTKRLRGHLTETKDHQRRLASRISQIGGSRDGLRVIPSQVSEVAERTSSRVKGHLTVIRAAVDPHSETILRNAQEELRQEQEEILLYNRIEAFALEVGDEETAKLAANIRRDELRMAKYLESQIPILVRALVREQVPADQRRKTAARGAGSSAGTSLPPRESARQSRTAAKGGARRAAASVES